MNEDAEVKAVIDRLLKLYAEAMTTDQDYIRITATPASMRLLGLRGRVTCEHYDGRKTYSVRVATLVPKLHGLLAELAEQAKGDRENHYS